MGIIRLGLLGGGTVGTGFLTLLHRRASLLQSLGVTVELLPVLVRDSSRPRNHEHPAAQFTSDAGDLAGADVLVEVMGGLDRPLELVLPHLEAGRPLVTANKAMLAEHWPALRPHAQAGRIYYEAAVMAGTPAIGPLATVLRASRPLELHAVLSGTCNYIISRMEEGSDYAAALAEAQAIGYAEDPPTLDVGGWDAAHKLTVLARTAFDPDFAFDSVEVQGIVGLTRNAVTRARERGESLKLVASMLPGDGRWRAKVRPVLVPPGHPLAEAGGTRNALLFVGDACGPVILSGGGAGSLVTASAVLADLLDLLAGHPGHTPAPERALVPEDHHAESFQEVL